MTRAGDRLEIAGDLRIADGRSVWHRLRALAHEPPAALDLDIARVTSIDGGVMALIVAVRNTLARGGTRSDIVGGSAELRALVHLYRGDAPPPPLRPSVIRRGPISSLGSAVGQVAHQAAERVTFFGELVEALGRVLRRAERINLRSLPRLVEHAAVDGLPIVVMIELLVGLILAYQSARQIESFGANIYVADLVGIAVTRELGPLLAGAFMAGRSGASYAAELGTMRVNEEIDALRTMGFAPIPYLVIPRVLALAITAPIFTLVGDIAAVLGGMVVAVTSMELTPYGYLSELQLAVVPSDVWTGLVKATVFGAAIAVIGCQQGLATRGSAAAVGRATTATVVSSLAAIAVIDTLLTLLFVALDV